MMCPLVLLSKNQIYHITNHLENATITLETVALRSSCNLRLSVNP